MTVSSASHKDNSEFRGKRIRVNICKSWNPLWLSIGLHLCPFIFGAIFWWWGRHQPKIQKIQFEVYTRPQLASTTLKIENPLPKPDKIKESRLKKQVFGISNRAIQAPENAGEAGVSVKLGNTIAKEVDHEKLDPSDSETLPLPTDDFLVTQMPRLAAEFRIPYPSEARSKNVEGPVVMDLLIDAKGVVRQVNVISGPGFGLNEAAASALKQFKFVPAAVKEQAVAVKIRYTYRFILTP